MERIENSNRGAIRQSSPKIKEIDKDSDYFRD